MKYFKQARFDSASKFGAALGSLRDTALRQDPRSVTLGFGSCRRTDTRASSPGCSRVPCAFRLQHATGSGPPCVTLNTQPTLHDPPTYSTIFSKIFQPSCAIGTGTCHTSDARKLGLYFEDPAQAYQLLLGKTDGRARVLPDDPGCSILAKRILSKDLHSGCRPVTFLVGRRDLRHREMAGRRGKRQLKCALDANGYRD